MIRRFFSQATMKLLRQAKTNYPMSRPSFHQDKASDNRSYRQADDETSDNGNRDGHGDTTSNRTKRTIMLMATLGTVATNNSHTRPSTGAPARRGEPGYWKRRDRDGDGIACEPWPPRVSNRF